MYCKVVDGSMASVSTTWCSIQKGLKFDSNLYGIKNHYQENNPISLHFSQTWLSRRRQALPFENQHTCSVEYSYITCTVYTSGQ